MSSCNFVVFLLNRIAELMHIVDKQSSKVPVKQASKKSDVYSLVCFLNTAQSVWCEFRIVKYLVYECNCNLHSCVHVVHVWCVLAGPSGFVPRPWLSTCVVCARRAEWFCPSSMVVNTQKKILKFPKVCHKTCLTSSNGWSIALDLCCLCIL